MKTQPAEIAVLRRDICLQRDSAADLFDEVCAAPGRIIRTNKTDNGNAKLVRHAVPCVRFDGDASSPRARLAQWRRIVPACDLTLPPGQRSPDFRAAAVAWILDDLVLADGSMTSLGVARSPHRIQADGNDDCVVVLVTRGAWSGHASGRRIAAVAGQVAVFDLSHSWTLEASDGHYIALTVRRSSVSTMAPAISALHGRLLEGSAGRIFGDHLTRLATMMPSVFADEVAAIRIATLRLMIQCVVTQRPADDDPAHRDRMSRLQRVRHYIDQNLSSAALSPERISVDLGVSRSTLYRTFAFAGGVSSYIRRRRLEAAHASLCQSDRSPNISRLAHTFGFKSDRHLSAAFQNQFGYRPLNLRGGTARPIERTADHVPAPTPRARDR